MAGMRAFRLVQGSTVGAFAGVMLSFCDTLTMSVSGDSRSHSLTRARQNHAAGCQAELALLSARSLDQTEPFGMYGEVFSRRHERIRRVDPSLVKDIPPLSGGIGKELPLQPLRTPNRRQRP